MFKTAVITQEQHSAQKKKDAQSAKQSMKQPSKNTKALAVEDRGSVVGKYACCANDFPVNSKGEKRKSCSSSDALTVYIKEKDDGSVFYDGYCWSCDQWFSKDEIHSHFADELDINPATKEVRDVTKAKEGVTKKEDKQRITVEERNSLHKRTRSEGNGYRGHSDWVLKFYGHRLEYNEKGEVVKVYYPETQEDKLYGYKLRKIPKDFYAKPIGNTGVNSQLSGQHKFPNGGKTVLIVGGEEDKCAAMDMLRENQLKGKYKDFELTAVVSTTTGEPSAPRQCRQQYEWFDKFDVIIIGMDNDEQGIRTRDKIAEVLPSGKVKIAEWRGKDPNEMSRQGKEGRDKFIQDYWKAQFVSESGVYDANMDMVEGVIDLLHTPKIPLPPFAKGLQEMTKGGGLTTHRIYNLIGKTSVGKSTIVNAFILFWMMHCSRHHKVGVVSLENNVSEWNKIMLNAYLKVNLNSMKPNDAEDFLRQPEIVEKMKYFYNKPNGEPRFSIVDSREGSIKEHEKNMERLYRQHGCTIIVNDVLTDILRVADIKDQDAHLNWQSNFVKSGATVFNVLHTRKGDYSSSNRPVKTDEYDALGSGLFIQKAAGNIVFDRNKKPPNSDVIEKNTTYPAVFKLRDGDTGDALPWYYDGDTGQIFDRAEFFKENPHLLPDGYDLSVSSFHKAYYEEGGRGWDGVSDNKSKGYKRGFSSSNHEPPPSLPDEAMNYNVDIGGGVVL